MPDTDLFSADKPLPAAQQRALQASAVPLAARMRPRSLSEYVGQQHILAPGKLLRRAVETDRFSSFMAPPASARPR
jgi:putative ATPase